MLTQNTPTTWCPSPDGAKTAELFEEPDGFDRHFGVRIVFAGKPASIAVYHSPDEGSPGSERFIWSLDSSTVLLVGRHFSVDPDVRTSAGESVYLLFDINNRRLWSNARQRPNLPRITAELLEKIPFTERVVSARALSIELRRVGSDDSTLTIRQALCVGKARRISRVVKL